MCDYELYVTFSCLQCNEHSSLRVRLNEALKIAMYKTLLLMSVLNQDRSVGIETGHGLDDRYSIPGSNFPSLHSVYIGYGANTAS
jgi:hypothetical protein